MDIRLTQYSHGAGCGCKISPAVLDTILHSEIKTGELGHDKYGNQAQEDGPPSAVE